jgi:hypothetical protein
MSSVSRARKSQCADLEWSRVLSQKLQAVANLFKV